MRSRAASALVFAIAAAAGAQEVPKAAGSPAPPPTEWEFSASGFAYFVPHDTDYGTGTLTADRGAFHLEARYNYEALDTGSAWIGANFSFGKELALELTPMLGGIFGKSHGVAPGYHLTLSYKKFELYSEGEYLFDTDSHVDSYFYNWSELTYSPVEWLRAGLVSQRTRVYKTPLDVQRGFLVGATYQSWTITVYVFNAGWADPTTVVSLGLSF